MNQTPTTTPSCLTPFSIEVLPHVNSLEYIPRNLRHVFCILSSSPGLPDQGHVHRRWCSWPSIYRRFRGSLFSARAIRAADTMLAVRNLPSRATRRATVLTLLLHRGLTHSLRRSRQDYGSIRS